MTENLRQHRGESNVWARRPAQLDGGRWFALIAAGACLAAGMRRRSAAGLCLAVAGGALAWWTAASAEERRARRDALGRGWRTRRLDDAVDEASLESFPASDAPAQVGPTPG